MHSQIEAAARSPGASPTTAFSAPARRWNSSSLLFSGSALGARELENDRHLPVWVRAGKAFFQKTITTG